MTSVAVPHLDTRCARAVAASVSTDAGAKEPDEATSLVIRRVNLWPVTVLAFVFLLAAAALAVGAGVVTWIVLNRLGFVDHVERLMVDIGFETFDLRGEPLLRALAIGAGSAVVVGTFLVVLATAVFNLFNRLVGGLSLRIAERPPARGSAGHVPPQGTAGVTGRNAYVRVSEAGIPRDIRQPDGRRLPMRARHRRRHGADRVRGRRAPGQRDRRPAAA
ncbi:MAG TPA: DUF3566 domain-containing protein [Acidimicrobiales bacterium]|nr:DUF3566 domain-containing protein [Acidimicrobiales bacterium]